MFTTFKEIESYVLSQNMKKRIALANAHDEPALSAVVNAKRRGVVEGTLIGKKAEIIQMLHNMGESETDYEIIDFDGEELESAKIAIKLVKEGKADIPMKGILQTSNFARAILNRETGRQWPPSGEPVRHFRVRGPLYHDHRRRYQYKSRCGDADRHRRKCPARGQGPGQ